MGFHYTLLLVVVAVLGVSECSIQLCSFDEAEQVMSQWKQFSDSSNGAEATMSAGSFIFKRLFELNPEARSLFTKVNGANPDSPVFKAHVLRVFNGLDILVNKLHNKQSLVSMLNHLSGQHVVRPGVTKSAFALMKQVMFAELPHLVSNFNPDSWDACISPIMDGISHSLPR